MDLFEFSAQKDAEDSKPLAEQMRPRSLEEFVGQEQTVGSGTLIRHAVQEDRIFSMILWGPPGCGKTTLARIFARQTQRYFVHFSAVLSGVKEIRATIEDAKKQQMLFRKKTILFVDEIHRFNKAQQDAFLHHVESGLITLIGATTENPSFEVIPPLMSRCRVITLKALSPEDISVILNHALKDKKRGLGHLNPVVDEEALSFIVRISDGDARTALNSLEAAAFLAASCGDAASKKAIVHITLQHIERAMEKKALLYDKTGENHYNLISAFHKSLRGSNPDGSIYWLTRMLSAGEDPLYIARRMVRFASEDIGNADPHALGIAMDAMEAFRFLGHPEGELALVQAAVYLSTAPKSNRIYTAHGRAKEAVNSFGSLSVPLHLRNAPTALMKGLGYGKGYRYAHDYKNAYVHQKYLPKELESRRFYVPTDRGHEKCIKQRLEKWQALKKEEKSPKRET